MALDMTGLSGQHFTVFCPFPEDFALPHGCLSPNTLVLLDFSHMRF